MDGFGVGWGRQIVVGVCSGVEWILGEGMGD